MTSHASISTLHRDALDLARCQGIRRAQLKHAQRQARRSDVRDAHPVWEDALAVYLLSDASNCALKQFVRLRHGGCEAVESAVTDAYIAWRPASLLVLERTATECAAGPLHAAVKFVDEWKLVEWIQNHNQTC